MDDKMWILLLSVVCIVGNFIRSTSSASYYVKAIIGLPNTVIHEFCHAFMAILTRGKVKQIKLLSSGAGEAVSLIGSLFSQFLVSLAGYIGASAIAYLFVWLLKMNEPSIIFYIFSGICIFTLLYIRNVFGFFYIFVMNAAWIAITYYDVQQIQLYFTYYIVIVCLAYSVSSAAVVLKMSFKSPDESGDAANLKQLTHIPAQIWGIIFLVQAIAFYYISVQQLLR